MYSNLTKGENFIVDWQYRTAGSFKKHLAEAMSCADTKHLNMMSASFPEEVEAYINYARTKGWWVDVKKRAGIEE